MSTTLSVLDWLRATSGAGARRLYNTFRYLSPTSRPLGKSGVFQSTQLTGTGSEVSIAHGLGRTPDFILVNLVNITGVVSGNFVEGTHDSTNVKVTVPSGTKYIVTALAF